MSLKQILVDRSDSSCELCGSKDDLNVYEVPFAPAEGEILCCSVCMDQLSNVVTPDAAHWQCLSTSMWSEVPAVQVTAWRMLHHFESESWARELLEMLYLDEATQAWAQAGLSHRQDSDAPLVHLDSNGAVLEEGDTVVLTKDLNVKGASFTAKRGTAVRRIHLDPDNAGQIEGKVEGQRIVILTQFVKKIK